MSVEENNGKELKEVHYLNSVGRPISALVSCFLPFGFFGLDLSVLNGSPELLETFTEGRSIIVTFWWPGPESGDGGFLFMAVCEERKRGGEEG